jgi:hypothetical protein
MFHAPFLERCQQLIAAALSAACSSIGPPLAAALEAAAAHDPEAAGQLQPGAWPSMCSAPEGQTAPAAGAAGIDRSASHTSSSIRRALSLHPSGAAAQDAGTAGFRNEVRAIQRVFDEQLHAALKAVLLLTSARPAEGGGLLQQQPGTPHTPSRTSSLQPAGSGSMLRAGSLQPGSPAFSVLGASPAAATAASAAAAAAGKQRARELEASAQQQCLAVTQQLAGRLQQQLQALPEPPAGVCGASTVEQVLLLSRVCSALAAHSVGLPAVLGPPDAWPAAVAAGPHAGTPGQHGTSTSSLPASLASGVGGLGPAAAALLRMHHPGLGAPQAPGAAAAGALAQLAALQQQLHSVACAGYAMWAAWVGASLAAELAAAVSSDELLHSDLTPLSWSEVKLAAGGADVSAAGLQELLGDASAAGGDMSFALPACPSASVMQLLNRACWVSGCLAVMSSPALRRQCTATLPPSAMHPCLPTLLAHRRRCGARASTSSTWTRCSCCCGRCTAPR